MEEILNRHPYFLYPMIQRYNDSETTPEERKRLRQLITVNIGDQEALLRVLGITDNENSVQENHSNFGTIDTFLQQHSSSFGGGYFDQYTNEDLRELIKNHKYSDAIAIIEHRNLINPQKNIYFAHQIRFLKKLIEIQKNKIKP